MYTPVFGDFVPGDDFRDWWRLMRRFAGQVYDVELPDVGRLPARARTLATNLGVNRLPPSLVEWISFLQDLRRRSDWATEDLTHLYARTFVEHEAVAVASTSVGDAWLQAGIAIADFGHDDPPVNAYGYVASRNEHVLRKSYPRFPLTLWALHNVLESAGSNYSLMGSPLDDPDSFLRQLPSSVAVSAPLGSLRFVEGTGWFAYTRNGLTPYGRDKYLLLRFTEGAKLHDIPELIRDQVQMTSASLRWGHRRQHRTSK